MSQGSRCLIRGRSASIAFRSHRTATSSKVSPLISRSVVSRPYSVHVFEREALTILAGGGSVSRTLPGPEAQSRDPIAIAYALTPDRSAGGVTFLRMRKRHQWQLECVLAERHRNQWRLLGSSGCAYSAHPLRPPSPEGTPQVVLEARVERPDPNDTEELVVVTGTMSFPGRVAAVTIGSLLAQAAVLKSGVFMLAVSVSAGATVEVVAADR
jgi:hypothetical protein